VNRAPLRILVAVALAAFVPRGPAVASTAPVRASERSMPQQVRVQIDDQGLREHQDPNSAELIAHYVREDVEKALVGVHGIAVVNGPEAPVVIVRLGWIDYHDSIYHVEIAARRPGGEPKTITTIDRHFFPDTALAEAVAASLDDVLLDLGQPPEDEAPVASVATEGVSDSSAPDRPERATDAEVDDDAQPRGRAPLKTMGKAGIGLLSAGVVGVAVGAGVIAIGKRPDDAGAQPYTEVGRDYRAPGVAPLVSGGVLMVAGAVLLVLDRRRAKGSSGKSAWLVPSPSGVHVVGRF